jgi:hypothetical protein
VESRVGGFPRGLAAHNHGECYDREVACNSRLIALVLTSLAFGQAQNSITDAAPKPAPLARLAGGVEVVNLKDAKDMALPYNTILEFNFGAQIEFFAQYLERSKTPSGLYLMDTELVPKQLPEILARTGLALGADGPIVNHKGDKVVMLLGYGLVAVPKKQGSLPGSFFGFLARSAFAASLWYSWNDDDAWGPVVDQWGDRVHTNIQQIEPIQTPPARLPLFFWDCSWEGI